MRIAGLHDEVGHDAEPAIAVEISAVGELQKVRDREGRPLGIEPQHDVAFLVTMRTRGCAPGIGPFIPAAVEGA